MLRCRDGSLYTGVTNDLAARLKKHNTGKGAAYTRSRRPVRVVFSEPAPDKGAALRREAALKKLSRILKLALVRASRGQKRAKPAGAKRSSLRTVAKSPAPVSAGQKPRAARPTRDERGRGRRG